MLGTMNKEKQLFCRVKLQFLELVLFNINWIVSTSQVLADDVLSSFLHY